MRKIWWSAVFSVLLSEQLNTPITFEIGDGQGKAGKLEEILQNIFGKFEDYLGC